MERLELMGLGAVDHMETGDRQTVTDLDRAARGEPPGIRTGRGRARTRGPSDRLRAARQQQGDHNEKCCGGTRALYQLLHLHLFAALRLNALVTVAAPLLVAWLIFWYYSIMRYGQAPQVRLPRSALAGLYVVVLLFAVLRNTGASFFFLN